MMRLQNNSTPLLSSLKGGLQKYSRALVAKGKEKKSHRFFAVATAKVGETRGERQGKLFFHKSTIQRLPGQ